MVAKKATLQLLIACSIFAYRISYSRIAYRIRASHIAYRISHSRGTQRIRVSRISFARPLAHSRRLQRICVSHISIARPVAYSRGPQRSHITFARPVTYCISRIVIIARSMGQGSCQRSLGTRPLSGLGLAISRPSTSASRSRSQVSQLTRSRTYDL